MILAAVCALATLSLAPAARADVTVGQVFAPDATACNGAAAVLQTGVASGNSYTVPTAGTITSWRFQNGAAPLPDLKLKVGRLVSGNEYLIVGESIAGTQVPNMANTFPASIPVQAGDLIGIYSNPTGALGQSCADYTGDLQDAYSSHSGDVAPGSSGTFNPNMFPGGAGKYPVEATVATTGGGSNAFTFGKLKRNKKKGTAKLTVNVPGPGNLALTGKGLVKQRPAARASKTVSAAGAVKLLIKAKGKKKRKLNETGKVKVKPKVTYTPTGGSANTQTKRIKLKKTL